MNNVEIRPGISKFSKRGKIGIAACLMTIAVTIGGSGAGHMLIEKEIKTAQNLVPTGSIPTGNNINLEEAMKIRRETERITQLKKIDKVVVGGTSALILIGLAVATSCLLWKEKQGRR